MTESRSGQTAIIGAGVMGETLLSGLVRAGRRVDHLLVGEKREERAHELEERYGVAVVSNIEAARKAGVRVSVDLNFRRKLWSEQEAQAVMRPLIPSVDLVIANEEDLQAVFALPHVDVVPEALLEGTGLRGAGAGTGALGLLQHLSLALLAGHALEGFGGGGRGCLRRRPRDGGVRQRCGASRR